MKCLLEEKYCGLLPIGMIQYVRECQYVREFYNPGVQLGKALEPVWFNIYLAIANKLAPENRGWAIWGKE